jgi:hypothetical protein
MQLTWEWPTKRAMEGKALVQINHSAPASTGWFGLRASPSMADALPEATDLTGVVLTGPSGWEGRTIALRLPGLDARKLEVGKPAAWGLLKNNTTCICVAPTPPLKDDQLRAWFDNWSCA